jgi:hypothetical protein
MKLFQIYEQDLADLEHTLPEILDAMFPQLADPIQANRLKIQWRRVREIIANVRWNYGPPDQVEIVPDKGPMGGGDAHA